MAERYTRIKDLEFPEQPASCPVTLDKGALLLDNERGQCILQLKLHNGGTKPVEAVHVAIACLDEAGQTVRTVKHTYTANAGAEAFFGNDQPIDLSGADVKDVLVSIEQAIFAGKPAWPGGLKEVWKQTAYLKALIPCVLIMLLVKVLLNTVDFEQGFAAILAFTLPGAITALPFAMLRWLCIGAVVHLQTRKVLPMPLSKALKVLFYIVAGVSLYLGVIVGVTIFTLAQKGANSPFRAIEIVGLIKNVCEGVVYLLLALRADKQVEKVRNLFQTNNIPMQIGLAVLTAFIIIF